MKKNPIIWFPEVRRAEIREEDVPVPGPGQYLLKSRVTLISTGTEMTAYCGEFEPGTSWEENFSCPYYPGYTCIGEIVDAGEGADRSLIGRRLATDQPHRAYGLCSGADPLAGDQFHGRTRFQLVPDGIADEDAVFSNIAVIVMNGIRASGIRWGESAVVFGQGLLGQFAARFLRLAGAFPVFACDVSDYRLSLLPDDPAIVRVNTRREDVEQVIAEHNKGRKADCLIELTANADLLPLESSLLREKGRLVILSSPKKPVVFDFEDFCAVSSISIIGCHNFSHPVYPQADNPWTNDRHFEQYTDLIRYGMLDVRPLVSRVIPYTAAPEAYRALDADRGREMGIILDWREQK